MALSTAYSEFETSQFLYLQFYYRNFCWIFHQIGFILLIKEYTMQRMILLMLRMTAVGSLIFEFVFMSRDIYRHVILLLHAKFQW